MTGEHGAFSNINTGVQGTVRFGDGSVMAIEGRGTILFKCKNGDHEVLAGGVDNNVVDTTGDPSPESMKTP